MVETWQLSLAVFTAFAAYAIVARQVATKTHNAQAVPSMLTELHGHLEGGNYTYYSVSHQAPIRLELISEEGDADLYVSDSLPEPTFELDSHSLSSTSCGVDEIVLDHYFQRPAYIAVYGHPRSEVSQFILRAYNYEEEFDPFATLEEPLYEKKTLSEDEDLGDIYEEEAEEGLTWSYILKELFFIVLDAVL